MFPKVSGSEDSKELPASGCFASHIGNANKFSKIFQMLILGSNTLRTLPVVDLDLRRDYISSQIRSALYGFVSATFILNVSPRFIMRAM
jgi:hypothetical protein